MIMKYKHTSSADQKSHDFSNETNEKDKLLDLQETNREERLRPR